MSRWMSVLSLLCLWMASGCAASKAQGPQVLDWKVESNNAYVLANEVNDRVVHVEVRAELPESMRQRIPLNLSLVLDHSGSMSGQQMEDARQALIAMLETLHHDDRVSVVAFSTRVQVLLEQEEWGDVDRVELLAKLGELRPGGTTAMQAALVEGLRQVRARFDAGSINRVMLLSDGIPNDASQLLALARGAQQGNIAISTFGLGPYYNEDLMAELADVSGGNYHFVQDSAEIVTFFQDEKRAMEQIVARNARLQVHLGPGVQVEQTLGGEAQLSGRSATIFLGDFGLSEVRQIALRLKVTATASGSAVEMLDAHLTWEDAVQWTGAQERWAYIQAESTRDQAQIDEAHDRGLEEKVGRLKAAWEMEQAIRQFEAGQRRAAQERMRRAAKEYRLKREEAEAAYEFGDVSGDGTLTGPSSGSASSAPASIDVYLEETAEELDALEPDSDKARVLIKKSKRKSRTTSGR